MANEDNTEAAFSRISRDIQQIRSQLQEVLNSIKEAESEVPEKMRRFVMYMHDLHDIKYIYEEAGLTVPAHVLREMERCDDRFRHLVEDGVKDDGGWINKVREDMTQREGNRWDHSRILPKQEKPDETGNGPINGGKPEGRAEG